MWGLRRSWGQGFAGNNPASSAAVIQTWTMTKNAGANGVYDAGASSLQTIAGNGYVEFTVDATQRERAIGFSVTDTNANYNTILFGILLTADATPALYKTESGTVTSLVSTYAVNDVIRVERSGTTVTYYRNGVALGTSAGAVAAWRVDAAIATSAGALSGIKLFDAGVQVAFTWQNVTNVGVAQP